ncbi:MAG: AsmA family protein, partial [Candidatus Binatia bacterium]
MGRRAFIAILVGLGAVWVLLPIPLNHLVHKNLPLLQQEIATALGRPLVFEDIRFTVWGGPALTAKNFRIADDPHFAATPFIEAKKLRMPLSWLSLLQGKIAIKRYILTEPEIQIVRNELGDLNVLSRAVAQKGSTAYFFTAPLEIEDGTIDFVDRSVKEPIEIRVQNVSMELSDYDLEGSRKLRLTANVFPVHGQEKNLSLEGWVKPSTAAADWTSFPLDVWIRTDGLLIANLVSAVPVLREALANYVDLVGPVQVETRLRGSIVHPHISNLRLAGAFFGSTKTNVRLSGEINCLGGDSCLDSTVQSEIKLDSVELARLRKIPFLEPVVPQSLSAEGPMTVAAELTGNLNHLNVHALIHAKQSAVRWRQWLAKPRGTPASLELAMIVQKDHTRFEDSLLRLHNLKLQFSGLLERAPK